MNSLVQEELAKENAISVVRLVAFIVEEAYNLRASDIHLEPESNTIRLRYRIDGWLKDFHRLPLRLHSEVISRIKILSGLRTDEHQAPQDGRFRLMIATKPLDIRVSIVPTYHGENAVLRLLAENAENYTLKNLGFSPANTAKIQEAINKPYGMVLATGPTGSGKNYYFIYFIKRFKHRRNFYHYHRRPGGICY